MATVKEVLLKIIYSVSMFPIFNADSDERESLLGVWYFSLEDKINDNFIFHEIWFF